VIDESIAVVVDAVVQLCGAWIGGGLGVVAVEAAKVGRDVAVGVSVEGGGDGADDAEAEGTTGVDWAMPAAPTTWTRCSPAGRLAGSTTTSPSTATTTPLGSPFSSRVPAPASSARSYTALASSP